MDFIEREAVQKAMDQRVRFSNPIDYSFFFFSILFANTIESSLLRKVRDPNESLEGTVAIEKVIKWHITDYPPGLNAFHWTLSELHPDGANICQLQRILFFLATALGSWNFLQSYVINL